mmetsp:Transcript_84517/g.244092  ORF Transcript_84517/g.244092 Transcript_84517/m.244092 type:complete len:238 (-) Transcript_84517:370-1083(-)
MQPRRRLRPRVAQGQLRRQRRPTVMPESRLSCALRTAFGWERADLQEAVKRAGKVRPNSKTAFESSLLDERRPAPRFSLRWLQTCERKVSEPSPVRGHRTSPARTSGTISGSCPLQRCSSCSGALPWRLCGLAGPRCSPLATCVSTSGRCLARRSPACTSASRSSRPWSAPGPASCSLRSQRPSARRTGASTSGRCRTRLCLRCTFASPILPRRCRAAGAPRCRRRKCRSRRRHRGG